MSYDRNTVVNIMKSWVGRKEADGSHKAIIDIYNTIKPIPRGYKVKYTDAWCATTVSAAFHQAGYDTIFPLECGCEKMIEKARAMGIWVENDAHVPSPGDCVLYDWQDNGKGDDTGAADHVGMVEKVSGSTLTIIEGNYSNSVKRRTLKVDGKYIRGYVTPKFTKEEAKKETTLVPQTTTVEEKKIWDYLLGKLGNAYGVAGLMGNLYAESGLIANNAQNSGNKKLGLTDKEYTDKVDNGSYANFVKDSIGYGLAQWTYYTRKQALLDFAKQKKASIGNLEMQLEYLVKELAGYKTVYQSLISAKSVKSASDSVLTGFEKPADQSDSVKAKRASYGQVYYDKYVGKPVEKKKETVTPEKKANMAASKMDKSLAGTYVTTANLNMRHGAGTSAGIMTTLPNGTSVKNYGYYSMDASGTKWLYVQASIKGTVYTGFCTEKYLAKK